VHVHVHVHVHVCVRPDCRTTGGVCMCMCACVCVRPDRRTTGGVCMCMCACVCVRPDCRMRSAFVSSRACTRGCVWWTCQSCAPLLRTTGHHVLWSTCGYLALVPTAHTHPYTVGQGVVCGCVRVCSCASPRYFELLASQRSCVCGHDAFVLSRKVQVPCVWFVRGCFAAAADSWYWCLRLRGRRSRDDHDCQQCMDLVLKEEQFTPGPLKPTCLFPHSYPKSDPHVACCPLRPRPALTLLQVLLLSHGLVPAKDPLLGSTAAVEAGVAETENVDRHFPSLFGTAGYVSSWAKVCQPNVAHPAPPPLLLSQHAPCICVGGASHFGFPAPA
jgi:hypothetical protein